MIQYCLICKREGEFIFTGLSDWAFGSKGEWSILKCKNSDCRLQWLSPQPVIEDIADAYKDYYTHDTRVADITLISRAYKWVLEGFLKLNNRAQNNANLFQVIIGALLYLFPSRISSINYSTAGLTVVPGGKLLEVGCGSGDVLLFLKSMGWDTIGVEVDSKASQIAREKGLNILDGKISDQQFSDSYFDAIVINHVLEHLHKPMAILDEFSRLLKPGGRLVIVTPNTNSLFYKLFSNSWMPLDPPRHLYLFSLQNLITLVVDSGLKVESTRTSFRDSNNVFIRSLSVLRTGSYSMDTSDTFLVKIVGFAFLILECFILIFNKNVGEEIIVTAIKN